MIWQLRHLLYVIESQKLEPGVNLEYKSVISNVVIMMKEALEFIIMSGIDIIIYILRPLYILMIVLGIIKYAVSGLSPRSRNILSGGILLAVFTEFILPMLLEVLMK